MNAHQIPVEPVFLHEGTTIYLRCVNDNGVYMGDLKIAEALMETHAHTLVNAANAGIQYFTSQNVERGLRRLLDEGTGGAS